MPKVQTLLTSLAFGESPRWHDGCLWFSDCGAQEVWAVDLFGKKEVIARTSSTPMGVCLSSPCAQAALRTLWQQHCLVGS